MMQSEIPSLKADIDNLLSTVKLNYAGDKNGVGDHGGAKYATDETRAMIPKDMAAIKSSIFSGFICLQYPVSPLLPK